MNEGKQKKLNSDIIKWVIAGLLGFVVILLIFSVGMQVGGAKARFSYKWADNYHKNFAGPRTGFLSNWRSFPHGDFIGGHGAFGEIIELNGFSVTSTDTGSAEIAENAFIIRGRGDVEKIIVISGETILKKGRQTIDRDGLKIGDGVVIIGSPNEDGQIEARLIRVFNGGTIKSFRK